MSQTNKIIGLIFAVIAATLSARAGGGNGDCETFSGYTSPNRADTASIQFYFRLNDDLLLRDYRENKKALSQIDGLLGGPDAHQVTVIRIVGSASPNGNESRNRELAHLRARAVQGYIRWKHPDISQDSVRLSYISDFLPDWIRAAERDVTLPRRDRVLEILRSPASLATKWANIQLLAGGVADYMEKTIFPPLRNAVSCVVVFNRTPDHPAGETAVALTAQVVESPELPEITEITAEAAASAPLIEAAVVATEETAVESAPAAALPPIVQPYIRKPLFALKTNLLFDAATVANLELEVPIGKRWSVAGEWMFPWWLWEKRQNCLQVMSGNIEGRYWFGNRDVKPNGKPRQQMTGWFAGLYAGGGYYDLEWKRKGYQGEFFIAAGISAGYVHTINKSGTLRMEYSLGVGYMQTNYRKYEAKIGGDNEWHLYRRESGRYTWIGPTRAKVSLVWMINYKKMGGVR